MLIDRPLSNDTSHLSEVILYDSQGEPFKTIRIDLTENPRIIVLNAVAYLLENNKYSEVSHIIHQDTF